MKLSITEKRDLHEFKRIIVNVQEKIESDYCIKRINLEESKHNQRHEHRYTIDSDTQQILQMFSIKKITKSKTELDVMELIRNELNIKDDDMFKCNKMIDSISRISICNNPSLKGESNPIS